MIEFAPAFAPRAAAPSAAPAPPSLQRSPATVALLAQWHGPSGLGDEIARLSAHIEAATGRQLELIRAFDESEGWFEEGCTSCAEWLSWRLGISPGAAREKVRVARSLGDLPALSAKLGAGELSYSSARALTRIATPENETELLEVARHTPAAQLERLVGAWRRADMTEAEELEDEQARHARRGLSLMQNEDGSWHLRADLDPEAGAVLARALAAAEEELYPQERFVADTDDPETPAEARRADSLGLVAEAALGRGLGAEPADTTGSDQPRVVGRAERFQVVVHVSAETLACGDAGTTIDDVPRIEHGPHVSAETARRLSCDCDVVTMTHGAIGTVLDVGRKRRSIPTAIRRALDSRDRVCRFPGCRSRFCDRHHVQHWTRGGATKLTNLVLLCRRHHRRVHEGGWRMEMDEAGEALFYRPDGRLVPRVPEPIALPADPVGALEQRHEARGLTIDPWTPTPDWEGERLDVDLALCALRGP